MIMALKGSGLSHHPPVPRIFAGLRSSHRGCRDFFLFATDPRGLSQNVIFLMKTVSHVDYFWFEKRFS